VAAQSGDRPSLDALLRRHYDRLYALSRRMLGNDPDALDATQEALISIARGLDRFDRRSSFGTWAYRVATNTALDELRRRRRRPRTIRAAHNDGGADDLGDVSGLVGSAATPDPSDAVLTRHDLDAALAMLPHEQRSAVVLRDLCDLDYAEIAEVLQIPIGTVRSRIARGRAALAERRQLSSAASSLRPGALAGNQTGTRGRQRDGRS